ncbi:MAG: hypothetical protein ACM3WU_07500 [Bacillota bacterium]
MSKSEDWTGDLSSWVQEFLAVSQRAWDCAAIRDFTRLAEAIDERNRLIKAFPQFGDLSDLPPETQRQIGDILASARKIDGEIQKALMHEMEQDSRAIRDTANRAKALSAYDRALPKHRRFDRQK